MPADVRRWFDSMASFARRRQCPGVLRRKRQFYGDAPPPMPLMGYNDGFAIRRRRGYRRPPVEGEQLLIVMPGMSA